MKSFLLSYFLIMIGGNIAWGDSWIYPTEDKIYFSSNGQFRFTALIPHRDDQTVPLHTLPGSLPSADHYPLLRGKVCVGILENISGGKGRTIWQRELVNPVCPLEAMITNNGAFIVTFDSWFGIGIDPIVIYDSEGRLVIRHTLKSLDLTQFTNEGMEVRVQYKGDTMEVGADEPRISSSTASTYWKEDGVVFFNKDQTKLIVHLYWGHLFGVQLRDGVLLPSEKLNEDRPYIIQQLRQTALGWLSSDDAQARKKGARLAGAERFRDLIPRLRTLLNDPETNSGYSMQNDKYQESYREYYVRVAARDALIQLGEKSPDVVVKETFDSAKDRAQADRTIKKLQELREEKN